eukprot:6933386-Prymnesium_polylepis.1
MRSATPFMSMADQPRWPSSCDLPDSQRHGREMRRSMIAFARDIAMYDLQVSTWYRKSSSRLAWLLWWTRECKNSTMRCSSG